MQLLLSVAQTLPANESGEDELCQAIGLYRQQSPQPCIAGRGYPDRPDDNCTREGKGEGTRKTPCATSDAAVKQSVAKFVQMLTEDKKVSLIAVWNLNCRIENSINGILQTLTERIV